MFVSEIKQSIGIKIKRIKRIFGKREEGDQDVVHLDDTNEVIDYNYENDPTFDPKKRSQNS